jgi:hypothetical protein
MNRSEGRHLRYPQVIGTSRLGQPCNGIHHLFKTHLGGWSFYGEMMLKKQAGKWVWVDEPPPPEIAIAVNDHLAFLQARPVEMTEVFGLAYNIGFNCKYWENTTLGKLPNK